MVLVFICLDWIAPPQPDHHDGSSGPHALRPTTARMDCLTTLATCIQRFNGAYPVLATRRMVGRKLADVRDSLGDLQTLIRDSVNTIGESAYELTSDFMVASTFKIKRPFEWVAIADSRVSFPAAHWHRVAQFNGEAAAFEAACDELALILAGMGDEACTLPTSQEASILLGDRHMVETIQKRFSHIRKSS
jgi:hypothetical protein